MSKVRFQPTEKSDFFKTLKQRVDDYFRESQIRRQGNSVMYWKTVAMYAMYLLPFVLILLNVLPFWGVCIAAAVMGFGIAGIGLSVMHDANHDAYSNKPWVNRLIGYSLNFVGGSSFNWKIQHNVLHHTYTNVHGMDEDLDAGRIMRFSLHTPLRPYHRFQHVYGPVLYGLQTITWALISDFSRILRYRKKGLIEQAQANLGREWTMLIASKLFYFAYAFVLPLLITDLTFGQWLLAFCIMHFIAGWLLSAIFQLAHIMEDTAQPMPDSTGNIDNDWAVHQLLTTANFANNNRLLSWYAGGLNFQIEHHLFPGICHVHYKKISAIVRRTAEEYGLPYHAQPTFFKAFKEHVLFLRYLGRTPQVQEA